MLTTHVLIDDTSGQFILETC